MQCSRPSASPSLSNGIRSSRPTTRRPSQRAAAAAAAADAAAAASQRRHRAALAVKGAGGGPVQQSERVEHLLGALHEQHDLREHNCDRAKCHRARRLDGIGHAVHAVADSVQSMERQRPTQRLRGRSWHRALRWDLQCVARVPEQQLGVLIWQLDVPDGLRRVDRGRFYGANVRGLHPAVPTRRERLSHRGGDPKRGRGMGPGTRDFHGQTVLCRHVGGALLPRDNLS